MNAFRGLLVVLWLGLIGYTGVVVATHGANLVPVFFGDILAMGWPGQFNADFSCFLILSALWHAWRYDFSAKGLGFAVLALFLGASWLMPFLLVQLAATRGDLAAVLVGPRRAAARMT